MNECIYYYVITAGMELVIEGNKITLLDKAHIMATEAFSVMTDVSSLGIKQIKLGKYLNVTVNLDFMSELDIASPLVQAVKEFEIRLKSNIHLVGKV